MDNIQRDLLLALPEIFLAIAAMIMLVYGVFKKDQDITDMHKGAIAVSVLTLCLLIIAVNNYWGYAFQFMFAADPLSYVFKIIILVGVILTLAMSLPYLRQQNIDRFEYPVLIITSVLGMFVMVSANSMLSFYMGLELQSLSLYILAAFQRDNARSSEAGLKYFVLGALSSGMLLFGISLIYGYTGTLQFLGIDWAIRSGLAEGGAVNPGLIVGMVFLLAGIAFKISAVPFHMWTPDVYQGAPTAVTAFFAIAPKVSAFAVLIRLLYGPFESVIDEWNQIIWFIALGSMLVGAFAALVQDNIKRLLAFSSISNIGYALIGLASGLAGAETTIFYMTIYMVSTAGVFALVLCLNHEGKPIEQISDLKGLSKAHPLLCITGALLLFSIMGMPPLAGFFGKLIVFKAAIAAEMYILATIGILTSVVAAFYYLQIIKVMFFDEGDAVLDRKFDLGKPFVLTVTTTFVCFYILFPDSLLQVSQFAVKALL